MIYKVCITRKHRLPEGFSGPLPEEHETLEHEAAQAVLLSWGLRQNRRSPKGHGYLIGPYHS